MTTLRAPHAPGDRRGHDADRSGAGDQDVLADQRERQRGVHGVAERVEDRGDVEVDGGPVHPHVGRGQGDVLGERPVPADAEPERGAAQVTAPGQTVAALAADQVALAADQVADVDVDDIGAGLRDLADELVSEDERGAYGLLGPAVVVPDVQVGAADAGAEHLDQYVRGADLRLGHVHQPESRLGLLLHECLHGCGSLRCTALSTPGRGQHRGSLRPGEE